MRPPERSARRSYDQTHHLTKCDNNNSTRRKPERMAVVHVARTSPSWTNPVAAPAAHNEASPAEACLGLSCGRAPLLEQGPARAPPSTSAILMQHENNQVNENTSDSSSAETTAFKALEKRVLNQHKALQSQCEQLQSQAHGDSSAPTPVRAAVAVVESRLEALVQTKSPVTAQEHKIEGTTVEHTIVEVIPERKSQQSLYVTKVYSPPRDQLTDFNHFIRELRKRTRGHRLLVVRDFNAPHRAWGCVITTKKGARVHDVAQQHGLRLWNDPLQPTRAGNSVSRDTNPDLTFTRDVKKAGWTSTIPPPPKEYEGIPNADLDRPLTPAELQAAISKLTRNTSPGKDRIVNKHLRQLPNQALTALLRYYNECWEKGELPATSPRFEYSACTCTATDQGPPRFLDFNTRFSNSRTS
ncbi:hypothetical protein HPB52_001401 [Rhipicephalus sanguineus]|uniref:Endonuclease/exonuclease/phosphatase domain-containing protein n=1 Tax=Rhipicephalus sanguineus TaxID=34632 RepID=A0A9D4Q4T5_RHISA|nr:hypothetical protein HPB52_001401 [Rhipicephalus sanguineus]